MKTSRRKASARSTPKKKTAIRRTATHRPRSASHTAAEPPSAQKPAASGLSIAHILVPIDFSMHSRHALRYAVPLAQTFGASLHLVFVVEPTIYPADLGFGQVVLPSIEEELRKKAEEELQALIDREVGHVVPSTSSVRTGTPHQEILDEAEERGAGLIVVAAHGHQGVEQLLFGSNADRIVHHAKCPVLVVRMTEEG